ncbi:PEP-CTERM sorting domain-containing protein [Alteromonas sp. Cnat3-28]|uniref:PEP-CTERM sorting domain-containing protein n=1 Tax=Alteromonas sp. Cnat3-28 TaxID=2917729 RepID=UPI001EF71756|nr:PEP-CTERM sorting domain-containing protein [Alteromonas sp. Cnat3-28]MCG7646013.1 PEP-CTERM sorting domain-containing protein [Alteromonas sp. Cnat3-28]
MASFSTKHSALKVVSGFIGLCCLSLSLNAKAAFIDIDFTIDGNTYHEPFTVTNNSSAGLNILSFALDLRPNASSFLCFDEVANSCHSTVGRNFAVVGSNDVGFSSYSVLDAVGGINTPDFLLVNFDSASFSSGEQFSWAIDIDGAASSGTVLGNELIGSLFFVEMSDGITYQGAIEAVAGNSDAGQLVLYGSSPLTIDNAINAVPEPSSILLFGGLLVALTRFRRKTL